MSEHIHDFYSSGGGHKHFHQVVALHDAPTLEWDKISKTAPFLPRGWFELSRLPVEDRIEFTREYWQSKLPYIDSEGQRLEKRLYDFFGNLDEIGIYAAQETEGSLFDVH